MKKDNRLYRIVTQAVEDQKTAIKGLIDEYEGEVKNEKELYEGEVYQWIVEMDRSNTHKFQRNVRKNNGELIVLTNKERREILSNGDGE